MPPATLTRDRPIRLARAALLVIDVQNGSCNPTHATTLPEFHAAATTRVIPNIVRLLAACHHSRRVHVVADAAYHGKALRDLPATCTFTTRLFPISVM